jgi:hypothetical protein
VIVGLLHPGEMGSAIGRALFEGGHEVLWASAGRSEATRARAAAFDDAGTVDAVCARAEVVFSVVPPHAAVEVARSLTGFGGVVVDANAIAPATAAEAGRCVARFVDGGIVGGPDAPRLYLSGDEAPLVAALFDGTFVATEIVSSASAMKCAYAAWTKGTAALLLAVRDFARAEGVEDALRTEWERSQPALTERLARAERSADAKGWRWIGEMNEIAAAFGADGLPRGFHEAAADVFAQADSRRRGSSVA